MFKSSINPYLIPSYSFNFLKLFVSVCVCGELVLRHIYGGQRVELGFAFHIEKWDPSSFFAAVLGDLG